MSTAPDREVTVDEFADTTLAAAIANGNGTTKADLLSRAKDAIEAGEQSFHVAAEALDVAQLEATQREIAAAVGKSVPWVNRLLQWRKEGCGGTPFGPGLKAAREHRKLVEPTSTPSISVMDVDTRRAAIEYAIAKGKVKP